MRWSVEKFYSQSGNKRMSRIGKQQIQIPAGVEVTFDAHAVRVKGPQGELVRDLRDEITFKIENGVITSEPRRNDKFSRSLWGTYMSHVKNMITGVVTPYTKRLLVEGVGFKLEVKGQDLNMALGFSHPVVRTIPAGLTVVAEKGALNITGIDKEAVALFANQIRSLKKPEPYKGKGIRYSDEVIRRKQGKKSA
jgi:large subunit ribosomal protein L6